MENSAKKLKKSVGENLGGISNMIYRVRGKEVMLDADLARIYGYETKALNRQVKRNIEKFKGEDFLFRLTWDEARMIIRCQKGTINVEGHSSGSYEVLESGRGEHYKYLPYAFTEQGVYFGVKTKMI